MIAKLSFKNIKKSFKDYAIYFFTLVLGVSIFYIFNSIDSQVVMLKISSRTEEIISLLESVLSATSVFVSFILGALIIYASRFLIKRRNKEFGIYLTLGMSKRKISLILFLETLMIGIISLAAGLLLGVFLSQGMSIIIASLFDADMEKYHFVFSISAMLKTFVYFGIMYLIVMIFNTLVVTKCKLIDLLYSSKKNEKVKIKNSLVCLLVFVFACALLGYAYYMVTDGLSNLKDIKDIIKPIIYGIISTFLIMWSLSGLVLKIVSKIKGIYYKGLNSFMLRQLSSKINTTVVSMSIICLMLFITICALSSSFSLRDSLTKNLEELTPADVQTQVFYSYDEVDFDDSGYKNLTVQERYNKNKFDYNNYLSEYTSINLYYDENFYFSNSVGNMYEYFTKKYGFEDDPLEVIMPLSDYNKIAGLYKKSELRLNEDEYIIVANFEIMMSMRNEALKKDTKVKIYNHELKPKYKKCIDGFVEISNNKLNTGIIVVPDSVLKGIKPKYNYFTGIYKEKKRDKKYEVDDIFKKANSYIGNVGYSFKTDLEDSSVGLGVIVTFLGIYLGVVFLISSAAILALKNLSEASDNRSRYIILRRIGADDKLIRKSLFREIFIFFMTPLLLAIIHSIFGMRFALKILEMFGNNGLLKSVIFTSMIIVLIYGGYFLITYLCSKNIIKE